MFTMIDVYFFSCGHSVKQECVLHSIADRSGAIAAHHRDSPDENTGFSFVNCVIYGSGEIFLGRTWGDYSRMIFAYSYIADIITPSGWSDWDIPDRQKYMFPNSRKLTEDCFFFFFLNS